MRAVLRRQLVRNAKDEVWRVLHFQPRGPDRGPDGFLYQRPRVGTAFTPNGAWRKTCRGRMILCHNIDRLVASDPVRGLGGNHDSRISNRRIAGIVTVMLALGIAAPAAGARAFNENTNGSYIPVGPAQTNVQAPSAPAATSHSTGGEVSEWGYVAIGSGVASLALISVGGTWTLVRRRQRQRTAAAPSVAA